jgi:hypothetical protein
MNLPDTLKVGAREIQVKIATLPPDILGMYHPDTWTIEISDALTNPSQITEVFIHEVMHSINDYIAFENDLQRELNDAGDEIENVDTAFELEENFTLKFAQTLFQVLKDNEFFGIADVQPQNNNERPQDDVYNKIV